MEEGSEHAGISAIRELVHSFLLDLCSSRKHGISFHDANFGTAGRWVADVSSWLSTLLKGPLTDHRILLPHRAGNIVLLQFLVGLKQATEDDLVAQLVVNVLKVSPDILARYFQETQYSYTPRLKSAWQDNVQLLKKVSDLFWLLAGCCLLLSCLFFKQIILFEFICQIYEAQPEVSTVFQTSDVIPLPRLLSMIMVISLPPVCNKAFFTQGLSVSDWELHQHCDCSTTNCWKMFSTLPFIFQIPSVQQLANTGVQLTTLSTMNFILKRANKNIEYLLEKSEWHSSKGYTADMMGELVQQYRETLSKVMSGKWCLNTHNQLWCTVEPLKAALLVLSFRFCPTWRA